MLDEIDRSDLALTQPDPKGDELEDANVAPSSDQEAEGAAEEVDLDVNEEDDVADAAEDLDDEEAIDEQVEPAGSRE